MNRREVGDTERPLDRHRLTGRGCVVVVGGEAHMLEQRGGHMGVEEWWAVSCSSIPLPIISIVKQILGRSWPESTW